MVANDAYYEQSECMYLSCGFCDGEGCCVCDWFGFMHKDHPMFGAILLDDPDARQQT